MVNATRETQILGEKRKHKKISKISYQTQQMTILK